MTDTPPIPDHAPDVPPSAKLVYTLLYYEGELSQGELAEMAAVDSRTIRYAVDRLDEIGAIEDDTDFRDARKRLYELPESHQQADTPTY